MKKLTTKQFIDKAKQVHNNKYDYSKTIYKNAHTKTIIICKKHGEFKQNPNNHLHNNGCSICANNIRLTTKQFINKANKVHNNKYDYSKTIYKTSIIKIKIICKKHGGFLQTPNSHLCGQGCPKCDKSYKLTIENFITKANKIHNNKYDYSKTIYKNTKIKIEIICLKHGRFLQIPSNHLKEHGCPKCNHITSKSETKWLDELEKKNNIIIERNITIRIKNKILYPDGFYKPTNTWYEYHGNYWHGNPKFYQQNDIHPVRKIPYGKLYQQTLKKEKLIKSSGYNLITKWGN